LNLWNVCSTLLLPHLQTFLKQCQHSHQSRIFFSDFLGLILFLNFSRRLSTTGIEASTQQHTERKNAIIGYMRTDKQKETELCMSAELELQRIRAKSTVDQQKILQLESEIAKLTNEVELNAKIEVEKDKETHEYKRVIDQLRLENEKLQSDFERVWI